MKHLVSGVALAGLLVTHTLLADWDDARLSVPVEVNGHVIPYPVFSIFVLPGSTVKAGFVDAVGGMSLRLDGRDIDLDDGPLRVSANPGLQVLEMSNLASGETCRINLFVMVPAGRVDASGRLNGYRIDSYPSEPLHGLDIYLPPEGFVEVNADNADVRISPNFRLGQFVAKQASGYPKYVVLRSSLILKLENILASLNQGGVPTSGLVIMSGYRTPYYNRSIGNVDYSRHVWGGAADIFIDDNPVDGSMDDLNGDGRFDRDDAQWLARFIDDMSRRGAFGPRIGGLGVYGSTSAHGPFVHVDVRGTRARW